MKPIPLNSHLSALNTIDELLEDLRAGAWSC